MYSRSPSLAARFLLIAALSLSSCNAPTSEPPPLPPAPEAAPVILADVAWPDPATIDRATVAALPPLAASRVRASRVPVLLPPSTELVAVANVATRETWTTASMRAGGVTVVVTASRAARTVPGVEPVKGNVAIRRSLGFVTQNERIWSVSWIEGKVAYSVEVECEEAGDARCADEAFAMGLARDLVFAGGIGAGAEKAGAR